MAGKSGRLYLSLSNSVITYCLYVTGILSRVAAVLSLDPESAWLSPPDGSYRICFEAMRKIAVSSGVSAKEIEAINALHPDAKSKKKGLAGFASSFAKQSIQRQISSTDFGSSLSSISNNTMDSVKTSSEYLS
uniref:Uncharacterized protein n=1 Tax=Magallana gigas TaxID=29159 RepID=K1S417_MAGGI